MAVRPVGPAKDGGQKSVERTIISAVLAIRSHHQYNADEDNRRMYVNIPYLII